MAEPRSWIQNFGVPLADPGFIYLIEHMGRYKIGRSKDPNSRIRAARTWLPDMNLIGVKPFWNIRKIEYSLHVGFAVCWYEGEWFELIDDSYHDVLIDGLTAFSDTDRDKNSVNFIYWFNGDGMAEFVAEQCRQGLTLPKFLRQESVVRKR